jgi:molybdopterin-guanine dinucleotide biosynthesis protein B
MVLAERRWVLMHETRDDPAPELEELLSHMTAVDLVLIEGFKSHGHDKLEVYRPSLAKAALWPTDPTIVAVASDSPLAGLPIPQLDLSDVAAITQFILTRTGLSS